MGDFVARASGVDCSLESCRLKAMPWNEVNGTDKAAAVRHAALLYHHRLAWIDEDFSDLRRQVERGV
jgi:hypothetical protein